MSTEITVKLNTLENLKKRMDTLQSRVRDRKFSVTFSESAGNSVDEFTALAGQLILLQESLAEVYADISVLIGTAAAEFTDTDSRLADYVGNI